MVLQKQWAIPTAVPVTKPKQNLGEKSLRHPKTNKIPLNTNKIPLNTNKISISSKHPLNHHEDFLGFVHKKNKCTKPSSKLLKTLLIRIQRENVWICTKISSRNDNLLPFLCLFCRFLVFDFLLVFVVSCSRNVEFFYQLNIRIGSIE